MDDQQDLGERDSVNASRAERTRRVSRQRILDSAARAFRSEGPGARLADIAAGAGMQAGSLYYHFDGRDALVEEVLRLGVERAWAHVREVLDTLPADASPVARLVAALRAHGEANLEISDYASALTRIFPMASEPVRRRNYALQQAYGDYFHALFEEAAASGELRPGLDLPAVRMLAFGALNWTAEWYRPDGGRTVDQVIDEFVKLAFHGILADDGHGGDSDSTEPS